MGSFKEQVAKTGAQASAGSSGSQGSQGTPQRRWWLSFLLILISAISWVVSIPLLMLSLGGSMQPHVGWLGGIATAVAMFAVLVQVDQRIAAATVFCVSFCSAILAGSRLAFFSALVATGMTLLNGVKRVCRSSPRLFDFQCRHYSGYHKRSELVGAVDSIKQGRSFFACHPHGVLSVGWISNVVWGRRFHQAVGRCFYLIDGTLRNKGLLARVFCDAFEGPHGGLRDTSKNTIERLMEEGESVCMIPGAYQEATMFKSGHERVALSQRKGFIKYCLRHGYRLHPVYTFGESDTYHTMGGFENFRLWLNRRGIPTVAFWGLAWCPLLPRPECELLTYVGQPLELPKIAEPSAEEVGEWHAKYVAALRELFEKHKAEAGKPHAELEVF